MEDEAQRVTADLENDLSQPGDDARQGEPADDQVDTDGSADEQIIEDQDLDVHRLIEPTGGAFIDLSSSVSEEELQIEQVAQQNIELSEDGELFVVDDIPDEHVGLVAQNRLERNVWVEEGLDMVHIEQVVEVQEDDLVYVDEEHQVLQNVPEEPPILVAHDHVEEDDMPPAGVELEGLGEFQPDDQGHVEVQPIAPNVTEEPPGVAAQGPGALNGLAHVQVENLGLALANPGHPAVIALGQILDEALPADVAHERPLIIFHSNLVSF